MKTIGIVGGIGPESTIDYYRSIIASVRGRSTDGHYPHIIIDSVDLTEMVGLLEAGKMDDLADGLKAAVDRLESAGADFAVFASNTPHLIFERVQAMSSLPLISIVVETRKTAKAMGLSKLGLFGTRFTMRGGFYQGDFANHGMEIFVPDNGEQEFVHDKYMNELVIGRVLDSTRAEFVRIARALVVQHGIEGLILGGTELPLLLKDDDDIGIPYLNTSQIHVESIVDLAVSKT
jgi:aspartate racemase